MKKYIPVFGDQSLFDGAPEDAVIAIKRPFISGVRSEEMYFFSSTFDAVMKAGSSFNFNNVILKTTEYAERRIIKEPAQHSDDTAVDLFAAKMKEKLEKSRDKGRRGWESCPIEHLITSLKDHISKGDPVDVANFAMMISQRGESIKTPVWTEIDRRSKKLPPVGVIVKWVNESYTAGTVGATYPDVGTDVLILAETDNANFSKKGVVFKWHTKHGVLTSFTTRAMDFSPIETPEEKSQREEDEFVKSEMKNTTLSMEWSCVYERGLRTAYRKLKMPEVQK